MKMNRRHLMLGTAIATVGIAGYSLVDFGKEAPKIIEPAQAQDLSDLMTPGPMGDKWLGKEDAPVTIIEYASMTCPHCAKFHNDILPPLKEKYIESGKVRLIFREFPFDPRAFAAFMLARCAGDEFYFPMIDVLFKRQSAWSRVEDPRPPLLQIAKLAGFTQESFEACLKNEEVLASVREVQKRGQEKYGVNATPFFFINGKKYEGENSVKELSEAIDALL